MISPLKHILCVDDDEDILRVTRLSLETVGGLQVSTCKDSRKALSEAKTLRPDMILLDARMPYMDGPSTLKAFQTDPEVAQIPVFFLTGSVMQNEVKSFLELGASGVIPKPFDPMSLPNQLRSFWKTFQESKRVG